VQFNQKGLKYKYQITSIASCIEKNEDDVSRITLALSSFSTVVLNNVKAQPSASQFATSKELSIMIINKVKEVFTRRIHCGRNH
jgi:hypothetical protein